MRSNANSPAAYIGSRITSDRISRGPGSLSSEYDESAAFQRSRTLNADREDSDADRRIDHAPARIRGP